MTGIIDAKEERDVMVADVPNAFIQACIPNADKVGERIIVKITGVLVNILLQMAPNTYGPYVVFDAKGHKVLYVQVIKALYSMLIAALLWYKLFRKVLESIGFTFNLYNQCVANHMIEKAQQTVRFHVDDLWSSHVNSKVNDKFLIWLNEKYGGYSEVQAERNKRFDYLRVTYDLNEPGLLQVDMSEYMKAMVRDFLIDLGDKME